MLKWHLLPLASVARKSWFIARSWSANSGDEIQGTWSPAVDLLLRRWRWGLRQCGFGFLLSRKRREKEGTMGCRCWSGTFFHWLQQQENLNSLLGLGVLIVEMRSEEHEVQQWIFCCVNGDEDCDSVGLVFYFQGREGKKKEHWWEEKANGIIWISSLSSNKKFYFVQDVSFFKNQTHTYKTHICGFWTLKHVI